MERSQISSDLQKVGRRFLVLIALVGSLVTALGVEAWGAPEPLAQSTPEETYAEMINRSSQLKTDEMNAEYKVFWLNKSVTILQQLKDLQSRIKNAHENLTKNQLESERDNLLKDDVLLSEHLSYMVDDHPNSNLNSLEDINLVLKQHTDWRDAAVKTQSSCSDELESLTNKIDNYLNREAPDQRFKRTISEYFTVLVGIVIVGFFAISFKDPTVGRGIFSGEAGLQFVTLFAVVIAIILFGVVGILDGKELAALLGGLSGYILGRTGSTVEHGNLGSH
jgi:hypothetical protein